MQLWNLNNAVSNAGNQNITLVATVVEGSTKLWEWTRPWWMSIMLQTLSRSPALTIIAELSVEMHCVALEVNQHG